MNHGLFYTDIWHIIKFLIDLFNPWEEFSVPDASRNWGMFYYGTITELVFKKFERYIWNTQCGVLELGQNHSLTVTTTQHNTTIYKLSKYNYA